jgi:hypothetical protein
MARDRDSALQERDHMARERDAELEERDRIARERDAALEQRQQARKQIPAADEPAATQAHHRAPRALTEDTRVGGASAGERGAATVGTDSAARSPGASERPEPPMSGAGDMGRRPRLPPAPVETRARHTAVRGDEPSPSPKAVRRRDDTEMWRARLLALAALFVALVVCVVILTAK